MAETKRFYWLKLDRGFFKRHDIRIVEGMPNGKEYVLFYLKLMAEAVDHEGELRFSDTIPYDAQMLSIITNTNVDVVRAAMKLLQELGMVEILDDKTIFLRETAKLLGAEGEGSAKMREFRQRKRALTNAERQKMFRAKAYCTEHEMPFIEAHANSKRYGGNYYLALKRDDGKCAICGKSYQETDICMHHIDGYDEEKPENNELNKLVTLCRECHARVHRSGMSIPSEALERIKYYDSNDSNNSNVTNNVTCNTEKEKEIEKDKEIYIQARARIDNQFAEFWEEYPRKVGKPKAKHAFMKAVKDQQTFDALMDGLKRYKQTGQWNRDNGEFIPHPTTWLNQRRWEDDIPAPARASPNGLIERTYTEYELTGLVSDPIKQILQEENKS